MSPRSEFGRHRVPLALAAISAGFAWQIGWAGWAVYFGVGIILVNLYPVLLQRYTRARLLRIATRRRSKDE